MKVKINNTVGGYRRGDIVEDTPANLKILLDRGYATEIKAVKDGQQSQSGLPQGNVDKASSEQNKSDAGFSASSNSVKSGSGS